ncbi:MAG TPA: hypothetical protein VFL31_01245 [Nitrospiraceae bacterium]|nr:hypothetical protein [Nitrospiraceae bacterium]
MKREALDGQAVLGNNDSRIAKNLSYPALDALLLFFLLNLTLQPLVDPDFGWHLRAGLDLVQQGWRLPETDPYSHTVPNWTWVEHAWLTDGLVGLIYQGLGKAGPLGVILFFAAVTLGAFLTAAGSAQASRTQKLFAVSGALWVALPFLGARTQMITLLGLALVLWLCRRFLAGGLPHLLVLPPLFVLWANLHGGFPAGLFTLVLVLAVSAATRLVVSRWPFVSARLDEPALTWSQIRHLALMIGLAALVTLINPYGWRLQGEIYQSLTDRFMLETLHEWQPVSVQSRAGLIYVAYLTALGIAVLFLYRRVEPIRWTILGMFLGLSLRHWRNVPFFLLVSVPLLAELLANLVVRASARFAASTARQKQWLLAVTLAVALGMGLLGPDHLERVLHSGLAPAEFFRSTEYPIEAVRWIREHRDLLGTKLYNDYGLGGFLLWWLPQEKVFIDGRMPAWRVGDRWIFYDYVALTNWDPPALGVLKKYEVDWAIVGRGSPLDRALAGQREWHAIYQDTKVSLYVRRQERG